jgi:hypothetical protein
MVEDKRKCSSVNWLLNGRSPPSIKSYILGHTADELAAIQAYLSNFESFS